MIQTTTSSRNLNADGLRGLASLSVVFAHYIAAFSPSLLAKSFPSLFEKEAIGGLLYQIADSPLISLFYNGQYAVLIFFILSGYVLTAPFYSSSSNVKDILQRRIWGRYFRLNIPIFATIIISFYLYQAELYFNDEVAMQIDNGWLLKYFSAEYGLVDALKIGLLNGILDGNGELNPPLWTIKVEFLGSLILMSIYLMFEKRHYLVLGFVVLMIYFYSGIWAIYYAAIFSGATINAVNVRPNVNYILLGLGLYFGSFQNGSIFYEFLPQQITNPRLLYNFLGAYLLTFVVIKGVGKGFLQAQAVQFLGKISYSLYIIHFLVLSSLASYLYLRVDFVGWSILFHVSLYFLMCIVVAYLFSMLIDKPSMKISKRISLLMTR